MKIKKNILQLMLQLTLPLTPEQQNALCILLSAVSAQAADNAALSVQNTAAAAMTPQTMPGNTENKTVQDDRPAIAAKPTPDKQTLASNFDTLPDLPGPEQQSVSSSDTPSTNPFMDQLRHEQQSTSPTDMPGANPFMDLLRPEQQPTSPTDTPSANPFLDLIRLEQQSAPAPAMTERGQEPPILSESMTTADSAPVSRTDPATSYTVEQLMTAMRPLLNDRHQEAYQLLEAFGVETVADLAPEQRAPFAERLRAMGLHI